MRVEVKRYMFSNWCIMSYLCDPLKINYYNQTPNYRNSSIMHIAYGRLLRES